MDEDHANHSLSLNSSMHQSTATTVPTPMKLNDQQVINRCFPSDFVGHYYPPFLMVTIHPTRQTSRGCGSLLGTVANGDSEALNGAPGGLMNGIEEQVHQSLGAKASRTQLRWLPPAVAGVVGGCAYDSYPTSTNHKHHEPQKPFKR